MYIYSSLDIPVSPSSINSIIQCVSVTGQIGFVYNNDVEPLHVISLPKQTINSTSSTMDHIFSRKTGKAISVQMLYVRIRN